MLLVDVDNIGRVFDGGGVWRQWWPLAGVNLPSILSISESDHMKLNRKNGQPLGEAVRDAVETGTGWRPSESCRIQMLTMPAILGYNFNPVSFYYIWNDEGSCVDTIIAEVTNTPW